MTCQAIDLHHLATHYIRQDRCAEAQILLERAIAIKEATLGSHPPQVAASLNNLAVLASQQGHYGLAETLYQRSLEILQLIPNPSHVAAVLNNLAGVLMQQGKDTEASTCLERALFLKRRDLGPTHPSVALSLNNFATLSRHRGHHTQAQRFFQRARRCTA